MVKPFGKVLGVARIGVWQFVSFNPAAAKEARRTTQPKQTPHCVVVGMRFDRWPVRPHEWVALRKSLISVSQN